MSKWTRERHEAAKNLAGIAGDAKKDALAEIERGWAENERLAGLRDLDRHLAQLNAKEASEKLDKAEARLRHAHDAANKLYQSVSHVLQEDSETEVATLPKLIAWFRDLKSEDNYGSSADIEAGCLDLERIASHLRAAVDPAAVEACARTLAPRLGADVRALHATVESLRRRLDIRTQERDSLLAARPAPATEAPHGDDPCAACSAILGSPQSCTVTHDVGPGAYPVDASLEARAKGAWIASEVRNPNASRWDDLEEAERCGWLAVVRAVDASRPALTVEEARAIAPTEAENRAWKAGVAYGRSSRPALTEDAQRLKLAADLRDIAAWHEGQANKDSATWAWHTNAASTCYAAAFSVEHGAAPKRPALTEEEAERAAVALADTLSDIPEGMFGTSVPIIKATLLRVSRSDIPADMRAGEAQRELPCPCGHSNDAHDEKGCRAYARGDSVCRCERPRVYNEEGRKARGGQ